MVWNRIFRVRLFWVKMILGNHFPPNPPVWLQRKMKFFGNSLPVDRNLRLWLGNEFTLSFSLQFIFGKRERERGREKKESLDRRERGRRDFPGDRAARQSTSALVGRSHCSSIDERRDRRAVWSSDECARQSCPSSIAIASALVDWRAARSTSRAIVWQARSSITIVDRATCRTIAPILPSPRNLIFSSAVRSQFDRIWWIFLLGFVSSVNECGIDSLSACLQLRKCMKNWACKAFSVKMFEWTKHQN